MSPAAARRQPRRQLMADRAYDALRDRIVSLQIAPGSPISDDLVAQELDMGRTPVREAIRRLVLENLAVVYPRRGTFASEINITDLTSISDIRQQLEGHAARRAAERLTEAQRTELSDLLAELEEVDGGDAAQLMALDSRIHRFVYRCAANPYLENDLGRYYNLSLRIWHLILDRLAHLPSSIDEHRMLLEAIRDGEAERAQAIASAHVLRFEHEIRGVL